MRNAFALCVLLGTGLMSDNVFADLPGGFNQFAATVQVYDHQGNPYPGIPLQLTVQTTGPFGSYNRVKSEF